MTTEGIPFEIPYLVAAGTNTIDGRRVREFQAGPPPWPFWVSYADRSPDHENQIQVGELDSITLGMHGQISAVGHYYKTDAGLRAARRAGLREFAAVSADCDPVGEPIVASGGIEVYPLQRIYGATQVRRGAFRNARVVLADPGLLSMPDVLASIADDALDQMSFLRAADRSLRHLRSV